MASAKFYDLILELQGQYPDDPEQMAKRLAAMIKDNEVLARDVAEVICDDLYVEDVRESS
jgi:hypothetical protein